MTKALPVLLSLILPSAVWAQNQAPIADAGADRDTLVNELTSLRGSATDPDGDPIVFWMWSIETQPPGSTPFLSSSYAPDTDFRADVAGDYVVSLVVSDGSLYSLPDRVTIHVSDNLPPTALALADVTSGPAPLTVTFDATESTDPEGRPLEYRWDFGDNPLPSYDAMTQHVYQSSGTYIATLRVIDDAGQADEDTLIITVTAPNNPPVVSASATPTSGTAPLLVQFSAATSDPENDPLTYAWTFGDGETSTERAPAHTYDAPGTYVAWLTVSDGQNEASDSVTIVVNPQVFLSTSSALIVQDPRKPHLGHVTFWGDFSAPVPAEDELLALYLDGVELFAAPLSAFRTNPGSSPYLLIQRDLLVRIDVEQGRIFVRKRKANLTGLNHDDNVDVELLWGNAVATDQIVFVPQSERVWRYERDASQSVQ